MLFFDPYMKQAMDRMFSAVEKAVAAIRAFTPDTELSNELRSMCNNVKGWKTITGFLRDEDLCHDGLGS